MKVFGLYDRFPRRYGKSKKIVYTKKDFLSFANRDNGYGDVFISVYAYERLKQINGIYRVDSESAIIDKIFMDMDFKDWESEDQLFLKITNLEKEYLRKDNILRVWSFSGGGFHLYVYISNRPDNKKSFCRNASSYISKLVCDEEETYENDEFGKIRRLWDPHCPIKLSQMARVIGTYNPRRRLFCVSLTEEDIDKGLDLIKKKAQKQNIGINYLGKKPMQFDKSFDTEEIFDKCSALIESGVEEFSDNLSELLKSFGILWHEIPICIKQFMRINSKLNYTERYLLITFLYRCGLTENEIKEVLKIVLSADRLFHCCGIIKNGFTPSSLQRSRVETQIPDIIDNDYYISCMQIRNYGFCSPICKLKDVLYYFT